MSFQLQGGNPVSNDYDYQSGSGLDSFLSRSIDEISWQSTLGTSYNSLSELPIGVYPTSATPTNFDLTQVTGSQGGTSSVGQTSISQDGAVNTVDTSGNTVLQVGIL